MWSPAQARSCASELKTGTYGCPSTSSVGRSSPGPPGPALSGPPPLGRGTHTWLRPRTSPMRGPAPGWPTEAARTSSSSLAGQAVAAAAWSKALHPFPRGALGSPQHPSATARGGGRPGRRGRLRRPEQPRRPGWSVPARSAARRPRGGRGGLCPPGRPGRRRPSGGRARAGDVGGVPRGGAAVVGRGPSWSPGRSRAERRCGPGRQQGTRRFRPRGPAPRRGPARWAGGARPPGGVGGPPHRAAGSGRGRPSRAAAPGPAVVSRR